MKIPASLIPGAPAAARKQLAAFEWLCLALVTLGYGGAGARIPRPRRYAGVLIVFFTLGLVSDMGRSAARLAGAIGGTLVLALLLNQVVSGRLIVFLGGVSHYFGQGADPPSEGPYVDIFGSEVMKEQIEQKGGTFGGMG